MFAPSVPRRAVSLATLLTLAATAQDAGPFGRVGADYFRAPVGTVWEYARTIPGAAAVRVEVLCRRESVAAGTRTVELRAFDESATEVRYWLTSAAGLSERLCHAAAARADEPEGAWAWRGGTMKTEVARRGMAEVELCWLTCPPGLRTEWALERPSPDEGWGRDLGFPALRYTARIEDFAAKVILPAGTFTTIKVAMDVRAADASLHQRVELWLARDVGVVKRVVSAVSGSRASVLCSDVLTACKAPASPLEAARAFVRARTDRWPQEPELVLLDDPRLRSLLCTRFVLLRAGGGHALLAVDHDGARVYDPARREDLQALARAELLGIDGRDASTAGADVTDLARASAMLRSVQLRGDPLPAEVKQEQITRVGGAGGAWAVQVLVKADDGVGTALTMQDGRVTSMEHRGPRK